MISLQPILPTPSTSYRFKRDAKYLTLTDAQNKPLEARYGIFREKMKGELLLLGFTESLNTPYLRADSQITISEGEKEEKLSLKGCLPLPPRISVTVK